MKELVKKYTELKGVSGNEKLVRNEFEKTFTGADELFYDNLGSIAASINANKSKAKKIGIFAHMDEVGLLIRKIEDNGIIKVMNIGRSTVESLICQRVLYINEKGEEFIGVIMSPSPHVKDIKQRGIEDLEISFGLKNKKDAEEKGFLMGTHVHFRGNFEELTNNNVVSKAADNRVGCSIVDELYNIFKGKDNNVEIVLGATVQEEMGLRGSASLLSSINKDFDQIIVIDTSPVDGIDEITLGGGPLFRVAEPRLLYDIDGSRKLREVAKKHDLKYQLYISKGTTDGSQMQVSNKGYKVNSVCVPAYNLHTNSTIYNIKDIENTVKFLKCYIEDME